MMQNMTSAVNINESKIAEYEHQTEIAVEWKQNI
jgi:hypothetical protein